MVDYLWKISEEAGNSYDESELEDRSFNSLNDGKSLLKKNKNTRERSRSKSIDKKLSNYPIPNYSPVFNRSFVPPIKKFNNPMMGVIGTIPPFYPQGLISPMMKR